MGSHRPMLGTVEQRGLYRALRAVTRDLGLFGLIQSIAPYSRLERQARGTGDIIVLTGQIRRISPHSLACNVSDTHRQCNRIKLAFRALGST